MTLFRRSSPFPEPIIPPFPGGSMFGGATSVAAMRNDAVWACVRLLAESVSMMALEAYTFRGGRRVPITPPKLLTEPEPYTTTPTWLYKVMVSALLRGNVYGIPISRDGNGYMQQIQLIDPDLARWVRSDDGSWRVKIGGVEYARSDIFHVPAYPVAGTPEGLSPVKFAAARPLRVADAAAAFGESFFAEGAHPSAVITSEQPMSPDMTRRVKDSIMAALNGREPAVLGGSGLKWTQMQIAPEEAQFLETQKFTLTQIARVFGVPPEMIGGESGNSMNYANVTQRAMDFLTYSVQPWLTRLEAAISALLPADRHVRFDTSALVRLDALTQAQVDELHTQMGAATINEIRHPTGGAPVPWGDEPWLPGIKTSAAAAVINAGAAAAAPDGGSTDDAQE